VTRFHDLVAAGTISHQPPGKYSLDEVRRQYITNLQAVASGRGGNEGAGLSKQRTRLEKARTDAIEFKNAVDRGEYQKLEAMAKGVDVMNMNLRQIALGTAGKIADTMAVATGCDRSLAFAVIGDEIREMLAIMADMRDDYMVEIGAEDRKFMEQPL
jgi:hypothetical protein